MVVEKVVVCSSSRSRFRVLLSFNVVVAVLPVIFFYPTTHSKNLYSYIIKEILAANLFAPVFCYRFVG